MFDNVPVTRTIDTDDIRRDRHMMRKRAAVIMALALCAMCVDRPAVAQAPADARLLVTVIDQTGGVIPGATVTLTGLENATPSPAPQTTLTSAQGVATLAALRPGRYVMQVEFSGFETAIARDLRLRAGDNRQTVTLTLQKLQDTVTVERDRQDVAADRPNTFGSALTREQIDALSDDPDVLRRQLAEMAGPGAIIRVDSFEGAPLPPKSQIKSIHITRDGFAAENHNAGAFFIDIVTQPGIGPIRGAALYGLRPGTLTGRSPFTPVKGPEQLQNYLLNLGGTLAKEKSSFSLTVQGFTSYTTPNLNVALPTGMVSQALSLKTPRDTVNVQGLFDYAVTRDQTLRVAFYQAHNSASNLGIGAFDQPERAYTTTDSTSNLRVQETGTLGRRFFINTRVNLTWSHNDQAADVEAPTIQVLDAFTSGGAQMAGERHSTAFTLASDLDYVRGRHSLRAGVLVDGGSWHSTLNTNYLGTYTFNSLAAFQAGTPSNFTRRLGDPTIAYHMVDAGAYV
jgi:carboxypeptidase family protein